MTLPHAADGTPYCPYHVTPQPLFNRPPSLVLQSTSLDFGAVVMGEHRTLAFTITNGGALKCPYTINRLHTTQPVAEGGGEADPTSLFSFQESGVLEPYSQTHVKATFRPVGPGEAASLLRIEMGEIAPEIEISLHGLGAEVPIYVERPVVDLRCCTFGTLFRDELVIGNRSNTPLKMQMRVPKELRGNLDFIPSMAYVQARTLAPHPYSYHSHPHSHLVSQSHSRPQSQSRPDRSRSSHPTLPRRAARRSRST